MMKQLTILAATLIATAAFTACNSVPATKSTLNEPVVTAATGRGFAQATTPQLNMMWMQRIQQKQQQVQAEADKIQVVFIGDSITHFWENAGINEFNQNFAKYHTLNLGFAGDQTQHTLYVIKNANIFNKINPKLIVLMIGTNNLAMNQYDNATIAEGIRQCVVSMHEQVPEAKIVLFGVFPRGFSANDQFRPKLKEINDIICKFADNKTVFYEDITDKLLMPDKNLSREIMNDALHPTAKGYVIWSDAIKPYLTKFVDK